MVEPLNDNHAHDARAVANLVLEAADQRDLPVTNLALQKLLYFAHGMFLVSRRAPLVGGYFEAWTYGPVHPQIYGIFKRAGSSPIKMRAERTDYTSGAVLPIAPINDPEARNVVERVVETLGGLPAARLVDLSHAVGGPWDVVVNEARTRPGLGLRISGMLIAERFARHKLPMRETSSGEDCPVEETRLTK